MCTFIFRYTNGTEDAYELIKEARYVHQNESVTVPEDKLLGHCFPLEHTLWLKGEESSFTVSGTDLRSIEVCDVGGGMEA